MKHSENQTDRRVQRENELLLNSLRSLPARIPPNQLTTRLRVMASRERARRLRHAAGPFDYLRIWADNLMRPLALPFAGGLVSAIVLFSMLVPGLPSISRTAFADSDVPTILYTEASLKSPLPFGLHDDEIIIDLLIDEEGCVIDYTLPPGPMNPAIRRNIENNLLFARFNPATTFGRAMPARLRFRLSQIEVKG